MRLVQDLAAAGLHFNCRHLASSMAVTDIPAACRAPLNMVRCGIDLHCGHLSRLPRAYATRPVFTLKTRLLAVRTLPCGATVGYNRTYTVADPAGERIGVVAIGYADGYPRHLSNQGTMLVRGRRCRVTGIVCMDYTMISLANVPDADVGDEVVVIGTQAGETVSITEVAKAGGTIAYEILCGLGSRVERRYL